MKIYSTADEITDLSKLEDLIALRQRISKNDIFVKRSEDSMHVQHLRKHPEAYTGMVDTVLESWIE
jgi:hypothetical protein